MAHLRPTSSVAAALAADRPISCRSPNPLTINDHHWPSLTITDHHWRSLTITEQHWPLMTITDHHWLSLTINDHQWPSLTVTDHYMELSSWASAFDVLVTQRPPMGDFFKLVDKIESWKKEFAINSFSWEKSEWSWRSASHKQQAARLYNKQQAGRFYATNRAAERELLLNEDLPPTLFLAAHNYTWKSLAITPGNHIELHLEIIRKLNLNSMLEVHPGHFLELHPKFTQNYTWTSLRITPPGHYLELHLDITHNLMSDA